MMWPRQLGSRPGGGLEGPEPKAQGENAESGAEADEGDDDGVHEYLLYVRKPPGALLLAVI